MPSDQPDSISEWLSRTTDSRMGHFGTSGSPCLGSSGCPGPGGGGFISPRQSSNPSMGREAAAACVLARRRAATRSLALGLGDQRSELEDLWSLPRRQPASGRWLNGKCYDGLARSFFPSPASSILALWGVCRSSFAVVRRTHTREGQSIPSAEGAWRSWLYRKFLFRAAGDWLLLD